jgi:N-hydroxyarylamine O-acetyltransferase
MAKVDVNAYLGRIKQAGVPDPTAETLRSLHRAHLLTVPFENLDIHLKREILCDESRILHKIVNQHRGGFCYELNGGFAALLRALGFQTTLLSARGAQDDGTFGPEFDHLTLRVDLEEPWLADVGFGDCFFDPLRLKFSTEQPQGDRVYRLSSRRASDDSVIDLEVMADGKWKKEYAFTLQPRALCDFAGMCQYHQSSPKSHFTGRRICTRATPQGRITLTDKKLIETNAGLRQETLLSSEEEWHAKLRELFEVVL